MLPLAVLELTLLTRLTLNSQEDSLTSASSAEIKGMNRHQNSAVYLRQGLAMQPLLA